MTMSMQTVLASFLANFPAYMTILALVLAALCRCCPKNCDRKCSDVFLGKLMFFAVGLSGLWGFVMQMFYPEIVAATMGLTTSTFQFDVATANLGMGIAGIFGWRASRSYRIATTIVATCIFWGFAHQHYLQLTSSAANSNVHMLFYNDLILPILLIIFLLCSKCGGCKTCCACCNCDKCKSECKRG